MSRLHARTLVLTRGDEGMSIFFAHGHPPVRLLPYRPREVYDVSGAGDTVVAAVALGLACGEAYALAGCMLADVAAGLVVGKPGVATPDREELEAALATWTPEAFVYEEPGSNEAAGLQREPSTPAARREEGRRP